MSTKGFCLCVLAACWTGNATLAQEATNDQKTVAGAAEVSAGVEFPKLTGPYQVGRASYHLVDSARKEIFTEPPDDVRELMVTVLYPGEVAEGQAPSPYVDAKVAEAIGKAYHKPASLFELVHSHAVEKAPCVSKDGGFPVVLFSPGFKAHPLFYSAMLEDLASHGFVVVSLCHPYSTGVTVFPGGRAVPANAAGTQFELDKKDPNVSPETVGQHRDALGEVWVADMRFVLDSLERLNKNDALLAGRLNLSRVGAFGHSFGGAASAAVVGRDERFRAGLNLDGSDFSGTRGQSLRDKFLWLCSEPPDFAKLAADKMRREGNADKPAAGPTPKPIAPDKANDKKAPPGSRVFIKRSDDPNPPPLDPARAGQPYDGMRSGPGCRLTIHGARHQTFASDVVLIKSTPATAHFALGEDLGTIDGRHAVLIVNALVTGFFRKHLAGEAVPFLDNPTAEFPEVTRR